MEVLVMTEKQLKYECNSWGFLKDTVTGEVIRGSKIGDLINKYVEENEELKKENEQLNHELMCNADMIQQLRNALYNDHYQKYLDYRQKFINVCDELCEVNKEYGKLKKENDKLMNENEELTLRIKDLRLGVLDSIREADEIQCSCNPCVVEKCVKDVVE